MKGTTPRILSFLMIFALIVAGAVFFAMPPTTVAAATSADSVVGPGAAPPSGDTEMPNTLFAVGLFGLGLVGLGATIFSPPSWLRRFFSNAKFFMKRTRTGNPDATYNLYAARTVSAGLGGWLQRTFMKFAWPVFPRKSAAPS